VFSVKLVARPDARMVEVPLEIEAELPREFDGAALLAASGLPRKVKIKAAKDSLKLSTAYRTDQLVGDIVKSAMRGTASDVQRVQDAVNRFIRTVRERRQEGALHRAMHEHALGRVARRAVPARRDPPSRQGVGIRARSSRLTNHETTNHDDTGLSTPGVHFEVRILL